MKKVKKLSNKQIVECYNELKIYLKEKYQQWMNDSYQDILDKISEIEEKQIKK